MGPTIFILFFTPLGLQAAPRNVLGGQLIGIVCGYLSLAPAGTTTLIVALGLVHTLPHIAILFIAVVLVVICAFVVNRSAGIPIPWWRPPGGLTTIQHESCESRSPHP